MPTILLKKSDTPGSVPGTANLTNLAGGAEVAVNTADKRMFSMTSASAVIELGTNPSSLTCADASFTVARVGSLTISSLSLTNATVTSATVTTLTGTSANITTVTGTTAGFSSANITQLQSTSATITTLTSTSANITTVSGTTATYTSATITNLNATSFTLSNLSIASANITTLTSASATITNLINTSASITTITNSPTFSAGTANGVLYLNGSKVATSGSALTWNGSTLLVGGNTRFGSSAVIPGFATASDASLANNASLRGTNAAGSTAFELIKLNTSDQVVINNDGADAVLTSAATSQRWIIGSEQMRLTSTGLGIGTTSPSAKLQVNGNTAQYSPSVAVRTAPNQYEWGHPNTAGYGSVIGAEVGSGAPFIAFHAGAGTNNNTYRTFGIAGSVLRSDNSGGLGLYRVTTASADNQSLTGPTAFFDSSGNVGIGTSTASFRVTNNFDAPATWGNNANNFIEMWQNSGTNALGVAMGDDSLVSLTTNNGYSLLFATSGTERMRIDSSTGNVGIGTASPTFKLVAANSGTDGGWMYSTGTVSVLGLGGYAGAGDGAFQIRYDRSTGGITFNGGTRDTPAARIAVDNNGNVGIGGTADANAKVMITGTYPVSSNTGRAMRIAGTIPSGTTDNFIGVASIQSTQAASFTLSSLFHFYAIQSTIGAGSAVTNQYGFFAQSSLTGATNNYGFYSDIASGSNRWNFYAAGTASNYMAGPLGVNGGATDATFKFVTAACRSSFAANNETYALGVRYASSTGIYYIGATNSATPDLVFSQVGGSERMRLTDGGELYIAGTTDQGAYNLQCNGTGVWGAGAYVNGSDARLKDNIQSLDSGLDVVKAMRPVTFQYKPEYSKDQSIQPGFIAQELQTAMAGKAYLDGVVQEGPNHLNVAYQSIIPILVKAIQELEAKVAALEAK